MHKLSETRCLLEEMVVFLSTVVHKVRQENKSYL